ncbi:MAG: ribose-5-phosphate isomerase RpiA [Planctomycetota bacterium]
MSDHDQQLDAIAAEAAGDVRDGMTIGLGNGRTARRVIEAIAARVKNDGLSVDCVAASEQTGALAADLGLRMIDFSMVEKLDYIIDGADEVDYDLRMLKCSGGAFTRERILAWAAARRVYVVAEHKLVESLGTNATFAVAVMAFGLASTRASLRALGLHGVFRRDLEGGLFLTDNGNLVLDVTSDHPERDPCELAPQLDEIPGVIDHGLFVDECDELLVGRTDGSVERIVRQRATITPG